MVSVVTDYVYIQLLGDGFVWTCPISVCAVSECCQELNYFFFKRFLKEVWITKCRNDWIEALADKVHKQGEHRHIPQHHYISHNHPYISIAVNIMGLW